MKTFYSFFVIVIQIGLDHSSDIEDFDELKCFECESYQVKVDDNYREGELRYKYKDDESCENVYGWDVDTEDCDLHKDEACLLIKYTLKAKSNGRDIEVSAIKRDCVKVFNRDKTDSCDWEPYNFISLSEFQDEVELNIGPASDVSAEGSTCTCGTHLCNTANHSTAYLNITTAFLIYILSLVL